jgi:hypothetical protein
VSEETWIIAPRGMAGKKLSLAVSSRPIVMVPDDIPQDVTSIALLWLGPQRPKPIERMLSPFGTVKLGESIGEPIEVSWPDGSGGAEHQSLGLYTLERTP